LSNIFIHIFLRCSFFSIKKCLSS